METTKEIKEAARKLLREGKAYVHCEPLEDQPGRWICYAKVPNEDGKTYQEGSLMVQVKEEGNRVKIETIPYSIDGKDNNTLAQHVILEHIKSLYDIEEDEE